FVLGVDLDEIEEIPAKNIKTIQGDITEEETIENIQNELPDSPDVILSDVSPIFQVFGMLTKLDR
ncbi:MAG: hypothetical protein KGY45_04700, partial [Hadesarchaea archaeon]|nr:hypothetical protein [Hadesarchaea archaeon]